MEFITELVGKTPYVWWHPDEPTAESDAPFYCLRIPPIEYIQASGCNCAGVINLLQLLRGLPIPGMKTKHYYAGGTFVWLSYLNGIGALERVDIQKKYPAGSLLLRRYRNPEDQGHLAVLYTSGKLLEQKLLHCYSEAGITIDDTVASSHAWDANGYYEFICPNWLHVDLLPPMI
jgi:hypothetical protein